MRAIDQVVVAVAATLVLRLIPGPMRWKFWALVESLTVIMYVLCRMLLTRTPAAFVSEIVRRVTLAFSRGPGLCGAVAAAGRAAGGGVLLTVKVRRSLVLWSER